MRPKRSMKINLRQQSISSAISISPNPINIGSVTSNNALFDSKQENVNSREFGKDNGNKERSEMKLKQLEQANNNLFTPETTDQNNIRNGSSQFSHKLVNDADQQGKKINQGQESRYQQSLPKIQSKCQDEYYRNESDKKKITFEHADFQEAYFASRIKNLMNNAVQTCNRTTNNVDGEQNEYKLQKPTSSQLQRPQTSYIYNYSQPQHPTHSLPTRPPTPYTIKCQIHKFNTSNKLINTIQLQTQIDYINPFKLSTKQSLSLYMLSMAKITHIVQQIVTHYRIQHHLYQVCMHIDCFVEGVFVGDGLSCCYDLYEGGVLSGLRVRSEHVEIRWFKAIKSSLGNLSKFIWVREFQVRISDKLTESVQITFRHMQLNENNLDNFKQFILTNSPHLNIDKALDILYDSYLNIGILYF